MVTFLLLQMKARSYILKHCFTRTIIVKCSTAYLFQWFFFRESYGSDAASNTEGARLAETSGFTEPENMTSQALMSKKHIQDALNQILDDVKNKRESDLHLLSDVKKAIMNQVATLCQTYSCCQSITKLAPPVAEGL